MRKAKYDGASVYVMDPIAGNRNATRNALTMAGFNDISSFGSLAELRLTHESKEADLLVIDMPDDGTEIIDFVMRLRRGEAAKNPFVLVILMVWNANWERVKKAMDSGCDDVLSRPYSLKQLEERVGFLVTQRKGFVVASDYIGPDRRKDISRSDGAPLLQVVNTLKLRTVDGLPPEAVASAINNGLKTSRDALVRSRMTRGAFQIGVLAGFLRDAADQVTAPVTHANDLKRIAKVADEVGKLAAQYDETAAIGTCDTVIGIARMAAAGTDFAKNSRLLMELSLALQATLQPDREHSELESELNSTLSMIKSRARKF
jgi:CheY-like chemotaxis protein